MTAILGGIDALYRARRSVVDLVDVPEAGYLVVRGTGDPSGPGFASAVPALYTVSFGAHFLLKKERGAAPRVMPLEALWWVDDPAEQDLITAVALGRAHMGDSDRARWRWQAMIMQPPPLDEEVVARALAQARAKAAVPVDGVAFERWEEGRCAQTLHVGRYAEEGPTIVRLHEAISAAGYRPRGRHHEIYLGDPRRSAPERLRTILRHPVEPLP